MCKASVTYNCPKVGSRIGTKRWILAMELDDKSLKN